MSAKIQSRQVDFCYVIVHLSLLFLISVLIKEKYDHNDIIIKLYLYEYVLVEFVGE